MNHVITKELEESSATISRIDDRQIMAIANALVGTLKDGNQIFFFGNGGSAADAQHLAAELTGKYAMERPPMRAAAFTNLSSITAIGNDYSYEDVFVRNVEGLVRKGDAVVGISTSGGSKNVVKAIRKAKEIGATTISFTGNKGTLKDEADLALVIPSDRTPRVQEGYMVAGHIICGLVEKAMFAKKAVFVDRDDTIVKDVPYCSRPEDLVLFPGVGKAIKGLNDAGYLVILVTNQSGVARRYFTEEMLGLIHKKLMDEVGKEGGRFDSLYYCPHHPNEGCGCRKPAPGLVERAMRDFDIDLTGSYIIGDSDHDMELGRLFGIKGFQVSGPDGFTKAVDEILRLGK
ncbi:MAG: HAD-IIIA family hydrolase [Euryarchaeota archaeon]|nr:HAD-IIIA family hydrolase [Euryarchaeota archaeon]